MPRIRNLADYQQHERQLFRELKTHLDRLQLSTTSTSTDINRFHRGSWVDPFSYNTNWNRTQIYKQSEPKAAVLLLHGLSDSPYSLRQLSERLHAEGAYTVALRVPGHGTSPSGLLDISWLDFQAAVRLAAHDLTQHLAPNAPFYIIGYSNGAALALNYSLTALEDGTMTMPDGMVMISPALGLSNLAQYAVWQKRLSNVPGFDKFAWNSIQPEFDPYKYNSFPINAGEQIQELIDNNLSKLQQVIATGNQNKIPKTLIFASAVDATVSIQAIIGNYLDKLTNSDNQFVVYDINRELNTHSLGANYQPVDDFIKDLKTTPKSFSVTILSNENKNTLHLQRLFKPANSEHMIPRPTQLNWPDHIFSLSHVALPIPEDDPIYGMPNADRLTLGNAVLRGERGHLSVPLNQLMRLRYNPFYTYQEQFIVDWLFNAQGGSLGGSN